MTPPQFLGQEKAITFFTRALQNGALSHACLLVGPHGTGKTRVLEWLARELIGPQGFAHPDVLVISRQENVKTGKMSLDVRAEQAEEIRRFASLASAFGGNKMIVVEEADALNASSANMLLKILEEPPENTFFFLRAASLTHVLPTLVSRSVVLRFHLLADAVIQEALLERSASEAQAKQIVALAAGRPGVAFSFFESPELFEAAASAAAEAQRFFDASPLEQFAEASLLSRSGDESTSREDALHTLSLWQAAARQRLLSSLGLGNRPQGHDSAEAWLSRLIALTEAQDHLEAGGNIALAAEHGVL